MGFLRLILALLALPFAVALGPTFVGTFERAVALRGGVATGVPLLGGFLTFLVLWAALPAKPVRLYVLGHELTHALWGLCFGARVSKLRVSLSGGSVSLTKSNVLITLAPYFFPFYTVLVVVLAWLVRLFVSPLPCAGLWLFAVGLTWCFHLCFTLQALMQRQPDVTEYGRVFSWVFIWIFNVFGVVVWILSVTGVPARSVWALLVGHTAAAYGFAGAAGAYLWSILPFNR